MNNKLPPGFTSPAIYQRFLGLPLEVQRTILRLREDRARTPVSSAERRGLLQFERNTAQPAQPNRERQRRTAQHKGQALFEAPKPATNLRAPQPLLLPRSRIAVGNQKAGRR